jgi:hypothetical protein
LSFLHSTNVVLEGDQFFTGLGSVVSEEFSKLVSVGGVFVDSELEVLGELFVELLVVFVVFSNFLEEFDALLDDVLLDDLEDLVLLKEFSGNVQRKIFGINNTLNERKVFRDKFITVVHDENSSDVELDVVLLLLGFEEIERSSLGDEEDSSEFKLTFNGEVLNSEMVFPIVGKGLVESGVFFVGDGFGLSHPDRLGLVKGFEISGDFLDLLLLLFLLFLDVDFFLILILLFRFIFIIGDFLFGGLFNLEFNGESNEFGVLLDDVLDGLFFEEFEIVALHVEDNLGTSGELFGVGIIVSDVESTTSSGFPSVLLVFIIRLGDDGDLIGNEESRVETDTELTNHGNISTRLKSFHESLGTGLSDGTQVVDKFLLGHTDTSIFDGKGVISLIGDNSDSEVGFLVNGVTSDGLVSDLVKSIRGVGNKFSKENFLVGVESVDDKTHQLLDISTESESVLGHSRYLEDDLVLSF